MARTYDEDEAAAILASAAKKGAEGSQDPGVTLAELEAAAGEAGLDGALVRDAARDVDRVQERPRGRRRFGATTRLAARARVDAPVDIDALANRLFAEMADRVGEPGSQRDVGEARVWQTENFGKGLDAGQGQKQSLTLRPAGEGAELVLREDVDREAAIGVGLRTAVGAALGAALTLIVTATLGPIDDAIALTVLSTPFHAALGWLVGRRWWRGKQQRLTEAHAASLRALKAKAATLALPEAEDEND